MEEIINTIITDYSSKLWMGFISLVITGFVLISIKNFITSLIHYFTARMSDIGFGQKIYYKDNLYAVREIKFKYLVIYDEEKIIRIPLKKYLEGPIIFPNPY